MAIISYADAYKKHLEEQKNADKKDIGLTRKYSLESGSDPGADIILGTLFMNPAKIARGVASATGKETSEGAKKAIGWASMPGAKIEQGFFGAAEGITDFLAGGAAQLVGQKDAAKWIYNHSWSQDATGTDVTDEFVGDAAETKGYRLASDLLSGVGNVAFQIAVGTLIGSALAAPAEAGKISAAGAKAIQYAPLFFSASGSGTAENMQKTGELGWRENVGGLLKGGVEVLTEIASPTGRLADAALFGKSAKGMSRYLVKNAVAKNIISNFAQEAGEEAASYVGDYFIEKWLNISDEKFSWGDLGYQAVLGGITGALFSTPSDVSFIRQARKAGAEVYAKGEAAVKSKIDEGLIEVAALKERGLNNDAVQLADAALGRLMTDEKLDQRTKEYYLGLAEQMVMRAELTEQYNALAKDLTEKAKADPTFAQTLADEFNAIVNSAGGEGKYTAADFQNDQSDASRVYVVAQMAKGWLSRSDADTAIEDIMTRKAALYQGTEEQKIAIRSMEDGSTVAFRVGENAYAVVTKRAGTDTYSVGYTTPGQVESDGTVVATHNLTAEKVEEMLSKPMTEQGIDAQIAENAAKKAEAEAKKTEKKTEKKSEPEEKKQTEKPTAGTEEKPKPTQKRKSKQTTATETATTETTAEAEQAEGEPVSNKVRNIFLRAAVNDVYKRSKIAPFAIEKDGKYFLVASEYAVVMNENSEYLYPPEEASKLEEFQKTFVKDSPVFSVLEEAERTAKPLPADAGDMLLAVNTKPNEGLGFVKLGGVYFNSAYVRLAANTIRNPKLYMGGMDMQTKSGRVVQKKVVLVAKGDNGYATVMPVRMTQGNPQIDFTDGKKTISYSPATIETEQTTQQAQTETKKVTPEDLSDVEARLTSAFGIDSSEFTKEEWAKARECVPNIDGLNRREQARVLTLVRTAQAHGVNEAYMKGLARLSSVYGFGVVFEDIDVSGFYSRKHGMVVINPNNLDETFGHEIEHSFDQIVKDGKAEFRTDLSEKVRKIVGASVFDKAKAQYKSDYDKLRARDGAIPELSNAELESEATANVVGKYLSNMTLLKKIAATDYSLGRGLLAAIRRMKDKWTSAKAFAKENDSTAFAEYRKMTRIENLLMQELGYAKKQTAKDGSLISYTDENGTVSFNVKTYREQEVRLSDGTKKSGREIIEQNLRKRGYSEKSIASFLTQLDAVADQMEKFGQKYPIQNNWNNTNLSYNAETGELVFSSLVNNGEYELNFDFSTVCKHREAFTAVLNKLVALGKGGQVNLTPKKIAQINTILKEHGFETACKMCFVEGKRNNIKNWATSFVNGKKGKAPQRGWNEIVRSIYGKDVQYANFGTVEATDDDIFANGQNIEADLEAIEKLDATVEARIADGKKENTEAKLINLIKRDSRYAFLMKPEDLYGTKGVSVIKKKFPEMYSILLQSYGVATPKVTLPAAPYASEMLSDKIGSAGKKDLAEYTFSIGGARLQSFSDFQMIRFLDYCQLIADGASVGAAMQSYTKEIDFVHLFGKTGMKINMSIVPGVDASANKKYMDGDYVGLIRNADGTFDYCFASESIQLYDSFDENGNLIRHGAFWYQNQDGYRENVGTILIGVSKYQILKAMADPDIRMVIPYHKSGLNATMAELYGISGFTDYTEFQHTRKKNAEGKWVAVSKREEFDFYESYRRNKGDARKACQEYIDYCKKNGFRPKFYEPGAKYEGIVYDKNGKMNPNYFKLIEDFSCYADGKNEIAQQRAVELTLPDDWSERVELGLTEAQDTATRLDSTLDSIINEVLAAKDRETNAQIAKRQMVAEEQSQKPGMKKTGNVSYSPASSASVDSDGKTLTAEQESFFRDSKVRDENGNLMVMYHGTRAFGFTVFDPKKSNDKMSLFFTNNPKVAAGYSNDEALGFSRTSTAVADVTKDTVLPDKKAPKITDTKEAADYLNSLGCNVSSYTTTAYGREIEHFSYTDALDHRRVYGVTKTEFLNYANSVRRNGVDSRAAYKVYLNLTNPLVINCDGHNWNYIYYDVLKDKNTVKWDGHTTREIAEWAKKNGYDGIIFKDIFDNGAGTKNRPQLVEKSTVCVAFKSNQIKSVGNETPTSNPDIRYSPASPEPPMRVVTRAQKSRPSIPERFTNAKGMLTRQGFRAALKNAGSGLESFRILTVNAQQAVENQLVRAGMTKRQAAAWSQWARTGRSHGLNAVDFALADMTGKVRSRGIMEIIEPFLAEKGEVYDAIDENGNTVPSTAKGGELAGKKYKDLNNYLGYLNAIDRANAGKNPYSDLTVEQMQKYVEFYEKKYPGFKKVAEELSAYNAAVLDIQVQAGMISEELAAQLKEKYPHYIPMRTMDTTGVGKGAVKGSNNLEIKRGLKAATESNNQRDDLIRNYIEQVQSRIKAAKLNMLAMELYETADGVNVIRAEDSQARAKELRQMERDFLEDPDKMPDPSELFRKFKYGNETRNEITFYNNGKLTTMAVSDRIYTGFSDLGGIAATESNFWVVKAMRKANDTFKKLVTNWNPFFGIKNIARDLQDGTLQTRHGFAEFLNEYRKNAQMMATGKFNDLWMEFLANGGLEASLFSDEFGTFTKGNKAGLEQAQGVLGQFQRIKNFNTLTEALPRFTEYCLTRKHGGTVQTALLNAADVTVNFGRSGKLTRILNSTVSPFLNPAVQGLDRVVRLFTEEGLKNNKALASLLVKAVLLAIIPMALSNFMYGDDDEYKDMQDSTKENNYLFKVGDTWLRLPRGRVVSTIAGLYNRSYKELMGEDVDWGDYGKNVLDQITPAQNVARHIASPFMDVANNKTWYGSAIESQSLQNYAVKDRYDENTSRISVWVGQFTSHFGLSPKKVNYLLDQYTGVIGDILLPTTTPAGTRGVVSYNFTVDPNTSSNLSNRFYDLYNKTMYKSNDGDVEAFYLKKRLDETKSAVSELFKEIKAINADESLSNKEKVKQASAIRAMINQLYKTALQDAKGYSANVKDALAINNSYGVVQITQSNARQYGLTAADAGKYAVTFGGQAVKLYGSEKEATEYNGDTSKKTVYAEANRLTYGSEYALKEYNTNVYEKAKTLNELGISYDEYYNYYMTVRYYSGKDKKQKILAYLNGSGMTKSQIALMMYYSGYSGYADDARKAINASSLSAERKKELLAETNK